MNEPITESIITEVAEALARRAENSLSDEVNRRAVHVGFDGRTLDPIAIDLGINAAALRQNLIKPEFRNAMDWAVKDGAELVNDILEREAVQEDLGRFSSHVVGRAFFSPAAGVQIYGTVAAKGNPEAPRYWACVGRLAAANLGAELDHTTTKPKRKASQEWVLKRGSNEEALFLFQLGAEGMVTHDPMEGLELLARKKLCEKLDAILAKEKPTDDERAEARWIIRELRQGDEQRTGRLERLRARLNKDKKEARDRVKRWRTKAATTA